MTPARSVWWFTDWVLMVGTSGSGPICMQECMPCGDNSGAADEAEGQDVWCLRHAGRTGHTGFRCAVTEPLGDSAAPQAERKPSVRWSSRL
ncbi:hypothetical protein SAMN05216511_5158 [Streptomyces sp. KS_16]|uniref:DUF7848 domain-containing protein n=1 Tax=Streptomyces sp. 2321.6 TaxID=1938840 RepID=UPI000884C2EF|nr:hypothetical protein BX261_2053 [Streptomyces sp. 2321.6]SDR51116.1 hypothetical protein SAMN05216511_5158 [Streptomyces sp. KS_16]SEC46350.1 hypothetical protein SAMN05428940_2054 [Streptomyces sp. 2133.1]